MPIVKITNRDIPAMVRDREHFKVNSVKTAAEPAKQFYGYGYAYHLTAEQKEQIDTSAYVVYSYVTPIAWQLPDGSLYLDEHKYSPTTSRTQGYVRRGMTADELAAHTERKS